LIQEIIQVVFNVLISIFNTLNVNSVNIGKDKNLALILQFVKWISLKNKSVLDKFFSEDESNFDNFCVIINAFCLLYNQVSLTYDANIAMCLIRFKSLISDDKIGCKLKNKYCLIF
jgi:hypothetical protein